MQTSNWNLQKAASKNADSADFGVYVHVPYCRVRCGYCDFNTYTATELRGTTQKQYPDEAIHEMNFAVKQMQEAGLNVTPVKTVFFGGGTPTLLPAASLTQMLDGVRKAWGVAPAAEITVEANPDSVDRSYLEELFEAGFTRISFGMQSAVPHVLKTLDRTHNPERVGEVVGYAKELGLQCSVDLIYGTPGESIFDWESSLDQALSYDPDHISAYALIVEEGTKLAKQIQRGMVAAPSDDLQADMYELADKKLADHGFDWYELSNWAKSQEFVSRHNLAYWSDSNWWGIGPGAHSKINGFRWWNVKHPAAYAERIAANLSPAMGSEFLSDQAQSLERVLLQTRLARGMPTSEISIDRPQKIAQLIADGLIDGKKALAGSVVLTLKGRLLADLVVHILTADT